MEAKNDIRIEHPEAWEQLVAINGKHVNHILFAPSVDNSLIVRETELAEDSLQALEDAVYEAPGMLDEYKRIRVMVHSQHFVMLPEECADDDCRSLVRQAFGDDEGDAAVCHMPWCGVKIAYLTPRGMQAFLGRTFSYPTVYHHLYPLCRHCDGLKPGDGASRMLLNLRPDSVDMVIYRNGMFHSANSYPFADRDDAVYYVINAWHTLEMDQMTDELQLMGDPDTCTAMLPELRRYVKHVMPAIYPPAAMRLGHNAMQAPLELILLALCE